VPAAGPLRERFSDFDVGGAGSVLFFLLKKPKRLLDLVLGLGKVLALLFDFFSLSLPISGVVPLEGAVFVVLREKVEAEPIAGDGFRDGILEGMGNLVELSFEGVGLIIKREPFELCRR
jgi:hypothetical protein